MLGARPLSDEAKAKAGKKAKTKAGDKAAIDPAVAPAEQAQAAEPEVPRIATNLLDVPPELIGLIDRYHRMIEIFFRFFKRTLGCGHLFWEHPKGILLEVYSDHRLPADPADDGPPADAADL